MTNDRLTPRARKVYELSLREALQLGHNYVGTEHILLGLLKEANGMGGKALEELGVDREVVRRKVIEMHSRAQAEKRATEEAERKDPVVELLQDLAGRVETLTTIVTNVAAITEAMMGTRKKDVG